MDNRCRRTTMILCCVTVGLTWLAPPARSQWRPKDTEWPTYTAYLAGSKYRPLD